MFSDFVIWYLFLAGTAAGSFVFAVLADVSGNSSHRPCGASPASCVGLIGSVPLLGVAAFMLFLDLGNPAAIMGVFENPFRSMVSIGAWLVTLGFVSFSAMVAALLFHARAWVLRVLEIAGVVFAVGIMCYTGVLLASMNSIDFWNTPLLVVLFLLSALGCGCGFVSTATFAFQGTDCGLSGLRWVGTLISGCEALVLVAFVVSRWTYSEAGRASCAMLLFGEWSGVFWLGLVTCGIVIPLTIAFAERLVSMPALRLIDGCAGLMGGICLRFCVVEAALYSAIGFVVS